MQISIVLLGVTGDLASRKIIPSIAALSHNPSYQVQMIGVSRSNPDTEAINQIIQEHRGMIETDYVRGDYTDRDTLQEALDAASLSDVLILYFAVPPHLFTDILKTTCTLDCEHSHIVVEKPFGKNITEAKELITAARQCSLTPNVHFFDHYLFKQATYLSDSETKSLAHLQGTTPVRIEVRALEALGVSNRLAYYDAIGATKDMWQHLYSLLSYYARTFKFDFDWSNFVVEDYVRGQYAGYADLVEGGSRTDTYFQVSGHSDGVDVVLESGKEIGFKETSIRATYADGTVLDWNIDPTQHLQVRSGVRTLHDIQFPATTRPDHTRLFQNIIDSEEGRFVSKKDILQAWEIHAQVQAHQSSLKVYPTGTLPQLSEETAVN